MSFWKRDSDDNSKHDRSPVQQAGPESGSKQDSKQKVAAIREQTEEEKEQARQFVLGKSAPKTAKPKSRWSTETEPEKKQPEAGTEKSSEPVPAPVELKPTTPDSDSPAARSALGQGALIQGKLTFAEPVRIDGHLSGEISSSSVLIVGTTGRIDGTVQAKELQVYGRVKGPVTVNTSTTIYSGGIVEGELETPTLSVAEGGLLNAECKVNRESSDNSKALKKALSIPGMDRLAG